MNNMERYVHIAKTMLTFEVGKPFTIRELSERAGVHYQTAKKGIHFFSWMKKNITFKIHPDLAHALDNRHPHERITMIKRKIGEQEP